MLNPRILLYKNARKPKGKQCVNKQILFLLKRITTPLNDGIGLYIQLIFHQARSLKLQKYIGMCGCSTATGNGKRWRQQYQSIFISTFK